MLKVKLHMYWKSSVEQREILIESFVFSSSLTNTGWLDFITAVADMIKRWIIRQLNKEQTSGVQKLHYLHVTIVNLLNKQLKMIQINRRKSL